MTTVGLTVEFYCLRAVGLARCRPADAAAEIIRAKGGPNDGREVELRWKQVSSPVRSLLRAESHDFTAKRVDTIGMTGVSDFEDDTDVSPVTAMAVSAVSTHAAL